jgi:S1-C subfamily serine protease
LLEEQKDVTDKGASMRLGSWVTKIADGTKARAIYGQAEIRERHRHRYEFNMKYRAQMEAAGFVISGKRIMTNAHVVSNATFITVVKEGDPTPWEARVLHVAHDCDLAILGVYDEKFFEGTKPLEFGGIPELEGATVLEGTPVVDADGALVALCTLIVDGDGTYIDLVPIIIPDDMSTPRTTPATADGVDPLTSTTPPSSTTTTLVAPSTAASAVTTPAAMPWAGLRFDGAPVSAPLTVTGVAPASPAAAADIAAGDRITAIDGTRVDTVDGLLAEIRRHVPGDVVSITLVTRSAGTGSPVPAAVERTVIVTLGAFVPTG